MRKRWWFIIILIILIIVALLFSIRLIGFVIVGTGINNCFDSDFGREYWEKGHAYGTETFFETKEFYEEDKCKNKKTLIENYCVTKEIHSYKESEKFNCPEGCEEGRCLGVKIIERF